MEVGMKKLSLAVAILLLLPSTYLFSQEWSAAQKDVWKSVEAYNKLGVERNVEGFMEYFHQDYCGWDYDDALPMDKAGVRKLLEESGWKTRKTLYLDQKPVAIRIFGDVAIVHYYYSIINKDAEGKEKSDHGRWTDILMKQGNKWVLIGDHGGSSK
jgi:ketosteroid isomerase-like protein